MNWEFIASFWIHRRWFLYELPTHVGTSAASPDILIYAAPPESSAVSAAALLCDNDSQIAKLERA